MKSKLHKLSGVAINFWHGYEKYLFVILLLVNLIPVLGVDYFFTGDGPAHLYNSNIILQLLNEPEGRAAEFFQLRYELIPNLGGHALLSFLNGFLPAAWAEKVIYSLCLLLLPLGFRYSIKSIAPASVGLSFLIFPLAHNFCFYIGFQSFCLGLALLFYSLGFFQKTWIKGGISSYVILGILLLTTAVFHLFTAIVVLMAIGWFILIKNLKQAQWRKIGLITISSLPALVFCLHFLLSNSGEFQFNAKPFSELLKGIVVGIPIITVDTAEVMFSKPYNAMLCFGVLLAVFFSWKQKQGRFMLFTLFTALSLFILYFVLPDKMASGGFISLRLLLCAHLFLALWISLSLKVNLASLFLMLSVIFLNIRMVQYHYHKAQELSADALAINEASQFIPEGSTVLPLNYSYHWLHYNIGLYPGAEKELIILDNYEASTTHFPVMWKPAAFPGDKLGDFGTNNRPLLKIKPYEVFSGKKLDAIIRWQYSNELQDSNTQITDSLLITYFNKVYRSADGTLEIHLRKPGDELE